MGALLVLTWPLAAQEAHVRDASQADMPAQVDSNSPAWWRDGQMHLFNSTGNGPERSLGADQFHLGAPVLSSIRRINPWPLWMEAVWVEPETGIVYGWYHTEHFGICPGTNFSVPQIGAAVSYDGGSSFIDLGAIISSGDPIDCSSQNGYFAGGNGDLSVMLDHDKQYFYFFFGNYGGPLAEQGVAVARMPFYFRNFPTGAVYRYYNGAWNEPGLKGHDTPIFPAKVGWQSPNADAFWGPSIHWNTYLQSYVILLNRSCCSPGFPQKGIYVTYNTDLSQPEKWSKPKKVLKDPGWYPQVLGEDADGTDRHAGHVARLYIYGHSHLEIVFDKPDPASPPQQ